MNKILIISYAFPPTNLPSAQRPYYFAKFLGKSYVNVTILTAKNPDSVYGINTTFEEPVNVTILRTFNFNISWLRKIKDNDKNHADKSNNFYLSKLKMKFVEFLETIAFPDKGLLWFPSAIITGVRVLIKNKNTALFSTSPLFSNHIVAYFLKIVFGVVWIADIRDFHYTCYLEKQKKSMKIYLHRILEREVIHHANYITFISNSMLNLYANNYSEYKNKFACIPNGLDIDFYLSQKDKSVVNEKINIVYAGSFYEGERSPFSLLNTLEKMVQTKLISKNEFVINIYGPIDNRIKGKIRLLTISDCVQINGIVSREDVFKNLEKADILWLIVGNKIHHSAGIPLKLFDYIMFKRFIWAFLPEDSQVESVLIELEYGEVFTPANENEFIPKILRFFELFRKDRYASPPKIPLYKLEKYSRQFQTKQLLDLVSSA